MTKVMWLRFGAAPLAFAAAFGVAITAAPAQQFPAQDIHFFCGFPPGSGADVLVRYFAEKVRPLTGKNIVVENKVGAGGMMAMEAAARSKPDGYSMVFGPGVSASSFQYKSLPFDPVKDFTRVAAVVAFPFVLLINPRTTPVNNVAELGEFLKKKDKVSYGAPNTLSLIGGAMFAETKDFKAEPIPYKSAADAIRDLNAGDLDFIFNDAGFAFAQMREGRLKGLAVTLPHRTPNAPELPTMADEDVPSVSFFGWMGVYMPAGVPPEITAKLQKWFTDIANSDETKEFYKKIGADSFTLTSDEFAKFEESEFKIWERRAKMAGVKPQ